MTFLTYNILDGGRGRKEALFEIIAAQHADVVLLQEVMEAGFVRELAARLQWNYFVAESNSRRTLALLTRYPVANASDFHPRKVRHTCLHVVVQDGTGNSIGIYGIHLCAPAYTLPIEMYRLWELHSILGYVQQTRTDRMVLAGDLNSIAPGDKPDFAELPFSLRLSIFLHGGYVARQVLAYLRLRGFTDVYRVLNPKQAGYTLPAAHPNTRLDYFFVNDKLRQQVRTCQVVETPARVREASDHLPVRMELEL